MLEGLDSLFGVEKPVIGVVHLLPLPGSPAYTGDLEEALSRAEQEAMALASGGADGIIVENFFDSPFTRGRVDAATACALTLAVKRVMGATELPVGVNVLRNDALTALAVATTSGASFIRVNVLSGAMLTDQGIIEGDAYGVHHYRKQIMAGNVRIFADVMVKHAYPLAESFDIGTSSRETLERAHADAIIVSGTGTGSMPAIADLEAVRRAAPAAPLLVGSGASRENVGELLGLADGIIVGTSLKRQGRVENPVDVDRVRGLVDAVKALRSRGGDGRGE